MINFCKQYFLDKNLAVAGVRIRMNHTDHCASSSIIYLPSALPELLQRSVNFHLSASCKTLYWASFSPFYHVYFTLLFYKLSFSAVHFLLLLENSSLKPDLYHKTTNLHVVFFTLCQSPPPLSSLLLPTSFRPPLHHPFL